MRRREFLIRSATAAGAAWLSSKSIFKAIAEQTLPAKFNAFDTVTLGRTGIKTSRLAMGTGTVRFRTSFAPELARRERPFRSAAQRIRPRSPLL